MTQILNVIIQRTNNIVKKLNQRQLLILEVDDMLEYNKICKTWIKNRDVPVWLCFIYLFNNCNRLQNKFIEFSKFRMHTGKLNLIFLQDLAI